MTSHPPTVFSHIAPNVSRVDAIIFLMMFKHPTGPKTVLQPSWLRMKIIYANILQYYFYTLIYKIKLLLILYPTHGSFSFFSSRRAPSEGDFFFGSKLFSSIFHRRDELFFIREAFYIYSDLGKSKNEMKSYTQNSRLVKCKLM